MIGERLFWCVLTMACVAWYSTITVYVAIRGASDIKVMLLNLGISVAENSAKRDDMER